ncbi:hypothetical protein EIN_084140 [Entamoeba invadens IP1]|uniref:hypothetical protein n=1 Tax=Entamoeba invadens IP1 TaxID=370355 RepID=UPI0002C3E4F1|nr:hypothetical protein EIN_084140 [Entamoeba invadens IP1]ELP85252.1 hypothetical protein EIN_084140 [Entamoeba invadens IP1]|eukprot:XP_004184598.1 hypothetical protein EIN_084140 [Entamoeba invadens IP1]
MMKHVSAFRPVNPLSYTQIDSESMFLMKHCPMKVGERSRRYKQVELERQIESLILEREILDTKLQMATSTLEANSYAKKMKELELSILNKKKHLTRLQKNIKASIERKECIAEREKPI